MTALAYHDHHHVRMGGSPTAQALRWSAAALCALTVHAGAAWWLTQPAPPLAVMEAAPAALEIDMSLLGFASADQVSSGEELDAVEPVPTETAETSEATPVQPVQQPSVTPPDRAQAEPPVETPAVQPTPVEPPSETAEAQPVAPSETQVQIPDVVAPSEVQIAAVPPVAESEPVEDTAAPAIQPVEELDMPAEAPRPTRRPEPVRTAEARPEPRRTEQQTQRTPPQRTERAEPRRQPAAREAGNRGQNSSDARQGQADGSAAGRANAAQARGNAQAQRSGNAAVSNYPGQVASKLRRSLRFPRGARGTRGEVHVAFTVNGGGGVSGARIARSSGHPVLDQAALETVQRAAPFPPIPADAGRSSWSFTVPLAFTR